MQYSIARIRHTTAFVTPVEEHWLERGNMGFRVNGLWLGFRIRVRLGFRVSFRVGLRLGFRVMNINDAGTFGSLFEPTNQQVTNTANVHADLI